jgi:hypothetical protein
MLMLLIGVGAFVALVGLTAYSPELSDGQDGGAHALSRSAVGYAGLARLLADTGTPVVISRGPLPRADIAPGLMIATPAADISPGELDRFAPGRPMLIVAPKWTTAPSPLHKGWVFKGELVASAALTTLLHDGVAGFQQRKGVSQPVLRGFGGVDYGFGPVESLQTATPKAGRVIVADEAGRAVLLELAPNRFLLSDPDLLNNQGLKSLATARSSLAILEALRGGQGPVVFDVTLNGFGRSRSLLRLALGPPFVGATLCALAAALLMGAHAAARFGAPRRPARAFALGKRALVDNAAVLIRLARREPKMGGRYADLTRRAVAQAVAAGGRDDRPEQVDQALDRLTAEGEAPFSALLAQASAAKDETELMQAARRLHQRRVEMTRERS